MGVRAILQRGRTHPLIVMPADAVDKINAQKAKTTVTSEVVTEPPTEDPPSPVVAPEPVVEASTPVDEPVRIVAAPEPVAEPAKSPVRTTMVSGISATLSVERGAGVRELPNEPASVSLFEEDEVRRGDDFTALPGVGRAIARRLKAAGFRTFEDVVHGDEQKLQRLLGAKCAEVIEAAKERL